MKKTIALVLMLLISFPVVLAETDTSYIPHDQLSAQTAQRSSSELARIRTRMTDVKYQRAKGDRTRTSPMREGILTPAPKKMRIPVSGRYKSFNELSTQTSMTALPQPHKRTTSNEARAYSIQKRRADAKAARLMQERSRR